MARYRQRYNGRSYYGRSYGREHALEHIRQAKILNRELGGTDEDVKKYFFSLSSHQLKSILDKYEGKHGSVAREYAEKTFNKWKRGKVHMSGMVAERLFSLLPSHMPLSSKYQLTESLWKHVGPSSAKTYYVGLDADIEKVGSTVKAHLEDVVIHYTIPESMEKRFHWLSQGDVEIKQKLLNHLRQQEKSLLSHALQLQLPVLLDHLRSDKGNLTNHVAQILNIGKHEVKVIIDDKVTGITEVQPRIKYLSGNNTNWIWWVIGIGILLWLLNS